MGRHKNIIEMSLCRLAFSVLDLWRTLVRLRCRERKISLTFQWSVILILPLKHIAVAVGLDDELGEISAGGQDVLRLKEHRLAYGRDIGSVSVMQHVVSQLLPQLL